MIRNLNLPEKQKEKALLRARKEVAINANGTSGYSIKEGKNAGKVVGHLKKDKNIIEQLNVELVILYYTRR